MPSPRPDETTPAFAGGVDSPYAWWRLVVSLIIGTTGGVGLWSSVVILPEVQTQFDVDRGTASLPYTVTMVGIMAGNVVMGRLVDRFGVWVPVVVAGFSLGLGYTGAALTGNFWFYLVF